MEKTSENPQQIETQDNKNDKNKATPAYTQQQLEANTQIKGFLAIYLLTAIIGVVYSLFLGLKAYNILGEDLSSNIAIANIFTILTLCYTGVYTIYAFIKRKANAVFYAKAYAGLMLFANILILITSLTEGHLTADCLVYLGGLCLGISWMGYLFVSTKVKELVHSACRNVPQMNRAVIIGLFTTSVVLVGSYSLTNVPMECLSLQFQKVSPVIDNSLKKSYLSTLCSNYTINTLVMRA